MSQKFIVDTNVLLEYPSILEKQSNDEFIVIDIVAEELDNQIHNLRNNDELAYKARRARNAIKKANNVLYDVSPHNYVLPDGWDKCKNDNKILAKGLDLQCVLLTNDLVMQIKADSLGLEWSEYENDFHKDDIYKGYKKFELSSDDINKFYENIEKGINDYNFVINEYLILINTDTGKITEERFNGDNFVRLNLPPSSILKGLNSEQRCALDLLNNKNITIKGVLGTYGSGKTLLSLNMGLYKIREKNEHTKLLAVRSPEGEGKEIGYLKGDFDSKTEHFFKPLMHSLKGGDYEMQSLLQQGVLEKTIPYFIKGTTYHNCFMFIDEAQDLCPNQLKMIGTRIGEDSVIVFCGDYKQAIRIANTHNPLVRMCKELKGDSRFGCVVLDEDVRSKTSKIFANLFE